MEALPVGEEELRQEVECFRSLITAEARPGTRIPDHCTTRSSRKAGMRLYAQLIEPVAGWVEKSERVLFMPSGPLQLLPWGALVRATGGNSEDAERDLQYLVEWKPLHSTIMPLWYTEVRHQDEHTARRLTLAVFGDPIYPQGAAFSLKPLPATRIEAEAIAKLYPGSAAVY
ncbi:MAG: CHAT domain-containing protein, partial [bacterium]|nr:CHAT domain-containing protein [bacterium]